MSHSYTKIWIHSVFGTKERMPLIKEAFSNKLYGHIKEHLEKDFDIFVKAINGTSDHVHILYLLNPVHSIVDLSKNIKGESSHWINSSDFILGKFAWQVGCGAFSVSESLVSEVQRYIQNQKEHHKKMTFTEEYDLFLKKYGVLPENR